MDNIKLQNDLIASSLYYLENWYELEWDSLSKLEKFETIVRKCISPRKSEDICWRRGLLAKAVLYSSKRATDVNRVESYFSRYVRKKGSIIELENIYNGEAVLYLYNITKEPKYIKIIEECEKFLISSRKDIDGSVPYFNKGCEILVDGLMCCPFIFMYQHYYKINKKLEEIGYNQILNFIKNGFDNNTSLPYHGYERTFNLQLGIPGWGRGVGWFLTSVVISLEFMDKSDERYFKIKDVFTRTLYKAIEHQNSEGLFTWCIPLHKSSIDTSATCMILFAIAKAINLHLIDDTYIQHVYKGIESMIDKYYKDGHLYQAMADCAGLAMYPQNRYSAYPWSDGFLLLLLSEIKKVNSI